MPQSLQQQTAARAIEAHALRLRSEGKTYDEIAAELGYANRGSAHKAVQRALRATIQRPADELRAIEMGRLEEAFRAVWSKATDPSDPQHLKAIDSTLAIMDRMDRLVGLTTTRPPKVRAVVGRVVLPTP